jgi:hypothetical protein
MNPLFLKQSTVFTESLQQPMDEEKRDFFIPHHWRPSITCVTSSALPVLPPTPETPPPPQSLTTPNTQRHPGPFLFLLQNRKAHQGLRYLLSLRRFPSEGLIFKSTIHSHSWRFYEITHLYKLMKSHAFDMARFVHLVFHVGRTSGELLINNGIWKDCLQRRGKTQTFSVLISVVICSQSSLGLSLGSIFVHF